MIANASVYLAEGQVYTHFLGRQIILEQFIDGGLQISVDELGARFAKSDVGEQLVNVVDTKLKKQNCAISFFLLLKVCELSQFEKKTLTTNIACLLVAV